MRKFTYLAVAALALSMVLPAAALAHDDEESRLGGLKDLRSEIRSRLNLNLEEGDKEIRHGLGWGVLFKRGTVTAVGSGSFTMQDGSGATFTVDVSDAKLVQLFKKPITLSDIHVNDKVWVHGNIDGTQIDALVVYDLQEHVRPAALRGEVTAVNDNSLTVETKKKGTVTVNTDSNTSISHDGEPSAMASVQVGSTVKARGLWDSILNVFTAIKLKIM